MSTTPKTPKTRAAADEALVRPVTFIFRNLAFEVTPASEWSIDTLEAFEDGKVTTFLRSVLGAAQWAALKGAAPKISDLTEFVEALRDALGISGN